MPKFEADDKVEWNKIVADSEKFKNLEAKKTSEYLKRSNKLAEDAVEKMKNQFRTPTDLTKMSLEDQSGILTLHFIGYMVKPTGISDELYNKCAKAFGEHRGKCEWEKASSVGSIKGREEMSKLTKADIKIIIGFWGGIILLLLGIFLMVHSLFHIWE